MNIVANETKTQNVRAGNSGRAYRKLRKLGRLRRVLVKLRRLLDGVCHFNRITTSDRDGGVVSRRGCGVVGTVALECRPLGDRIQNTTVSIFERGQTPSERREQRKWMIKRSQETQAEQGVVDETVPRGGQDWDGLCADGCGKSREPVRDFHHGRFIECAKVRTCRCAAGEEGLQGFVCVCHLDGEVR